MAGTLAFSTTLSVNFEIITPSTWFRESFVTKLFYFLRILISQSNFLFEDVFEKAILLKTHLGKLDFFLQKKSFLGGVGHWKEMQKQGGNYPGGVLSKQRCHITIIKEIFRASGIQK